MSEARALAISIAAAALIALYTIVLWRWPLALGLATGVLLGGLALATSVSLGSDPADADRAWREAAPDLTEASADPGPQPAKRTKAPTPPTPSVPPQPSAPPTPSAPATPSGPSKPT